MKIIVYIFIFIPIFSYTQTGPGGVGSNNGSSNLDMWFDANQSVFSDAGVTPALNTEKVYQWNNISNSSTANAIEATFAYRPNYLTNSLNGYPTIAFDGNDDRLLSQSANTVTESSIFIVFFGTYEGGDNEDQLLNVTYNANSSVIEINSSTNLRARYYFGAGNGNTSINSTFSNGTPSVLTVNYDGGNTSEVFNLGASSNTANTSMVNQGTGTTCIGAHANNQGYFYGNIGEIIRYSSIVNSAQQIIIENYLAAKYGLSLTVNDLYDEDNPANGNYDHDVAGIGRVDAINTHSDAQGTGIVRILNPTNLDNDEFLFWGHDNGVAQATNGTDVPTGVSARFDRTWRASQTNSSGSPISVGNVDLAFDLSGLGNINTSDLRLLIDTDNDGLFDDETPISGATNTSGNIYQFSAVSNLSNNNRFTIATINSNQTPLPVELLGFDVKPIENRRVELHWQTASETNNDYFTIERSKNGVAWEALNTLDGAGNSSSLVNYSTVDNVPYTGISYYRLKQTDFDGEFAYSDIRSANIASGNTNKLEIWPNPATNIIRVLGNESELQNISFCNMLGQDVTDQTKRISNEDSMQLIDLSNLVSGIYYLKTKNTVNKLYKH